MSDDVTFCMCSICLGNFQDPIILTCGHTFDLTCIQQMINRNASFNPPQQNRCPLCTRVFEPTTDLISNISVVNIISSEATHDRFLIDVVSNQKKSSVLSFLKAVFYKRKICPTNHVTLITGDEILVLNSETSLDQELRLQPILDLNTQLQLTCVDFEQKTGLRRIYIVTDGSTKYSTLTRIDSDFIDECILIHVGDNNMEYARRTAREIEFSFEHFNNRILDVYVQHFISNYLY